MLDACDWMMMVFETAVSLTANSYDLYASSLRFDLYCKIFFFFFFTMKYEHQPVCFLDTCTPLSLPEKCAPTGADNERKNIWNKMLNA